MPVTTIDHVAVDVDDEGFLTEPTQWSEDLAHAMGRLIDIELTEEHVTILEGARDEFAVSGEAPTLRRLSTVCGVPIKRLFELFPQKPAKKVAYLAGLPKPRGCV